jgi:polyisoprenoid-binding protein YceI
MIRRKFGLFFVLTVGLITFALPLTTLAQVETYMIDEVHSSANFKIRHLFSKVSGTFSEVTGKIWIDRDNLSGAKVDATISVYSLDTNHQKRDTHLRSTDFFHVEKYAVIHFVSNSIEAMSKNEGFMHGDLTIHGVKHPVKLPFKVLGFGPDPWGGYRSGFEASTVLKRSDYGITYGLDERGEGAVGNEVEVTLLIEAIKLGPDGAPYKVK